MDGRHNFFHNKKHAKVQIIRVMWRSVRLEIQEILDKRGLNGGKERGVQEVHILGRVRRLWRTTYVSFK